MQFLICYLAEHYSNIRKKNLVCGLFNTIGCERTKGFCSG
jgi:hypothetical protein